MESEDTQKAQDTAKKLEKKLPENFVDDVKNMDRGALTDQLVDLTKEIEKITEERDADATLSDLKESVKALSGGYGDKIKLERAKLKYILSIMTIRGEL